MSNRDHATRLTGALLGVALFCGGCGPATAQDMDGRQSVTITLTGSKTLEYVSTASNEYERFEEGSVIHLTRFPDGRVLINGHTYRPCPDEPRRVLPVRQLRSRYGGVPRVQDYLDTLLVRSADSTTAWNLAVTRWGSDVQSLIRQVVKQYADDVATGLAEIDAARRALRTLVGSELVEAVRLADEDDLTGREDSSKAWITNPQQVSGVQSGVESAPGHMTVVVRWAGENTRWPSLIELTPHHTPPDVVGCGPMEADEWRHFVQLLEPLGYADGFRYAVKLVNGHVIRVTRDTTNVHRERL